MSSSESDDVPLAQKLRAQPAERAASAPTPGGGARRAADDEEDDALSSGESESDESEAASSSDDDDDVPLAAKMQAKSQAAARGANSAAGASGKRRGSSDGRTKQQGARGAGAAVKRSRSASAAGDDGTPKRARKSASGAKDDKEIKWKTLKHSGLIFPPEYVRHGVPLLYDGVPVPASDEPSTTTLTAEQEEVATLFAAMLETDYAKKDIFLNNFWADFKQVLGKGHMIKDLKKCDFRDIYNHLQAQREDKKALSKEDKDRAKAAREELERPFKTAVIDGHAEPMGNFRVEPPGLFRGRGEHPKMGKLKKRIYPRDITINIGKGEPIPEHPYPGQRWREIRHDQTVTWLAFWKDPINPKGYKYTWLAANSTFKTNSDLLKYEKARELHKHIERIRADYKRMWSSSEAVKRQAGVALYFLDRLALRAGHEKDEDEADTVGCCTLKVSDIHLHPPNEIEFDFLGKDSIRYSNRVEVDTAVFKAMAEFKSLDRSGKKKTQGNEMLFDAIDANDLNKLMKDYMDGLSVKVFRTYNASVTLNRLLYTDTTAAAADDPAGAQGAGRSKDDDGEAVKKVIVVSPDENDVTKKAFYDVANKQVAVLCNHQRSVPKSHENSMEKLESTIFKREGELADAEKALKAAKAGKPVDGRNVSVEQASKKVDRLKEQIKKLLTTKDNREELKSVALGTSKINYLDPRITVAWCKRLEMPIEKIFNRSLLGKFSWAMPVEPKFAF